MNALRKMVSDAIEQRGLRPFARHAGISDGPIRRFVAGGGVTLVVAQKLAKACGYELELRRQKRD